MDLINRPTTISSSFSSRRYQSRSDLYYGGGYEELGGEDNLEAEFLCPFCGEDFDMVGLCCHIDEVHPVEVKNGVCPVCTKRVGLDILGHVISQHGSLFKVQRKRRSRRGGINSAYSLFRKEMKEANLQSLLGGSSYSASSTSIESDPLLSSFMFSSPSADQRTVGQTSSMVDASIGKKNSENALIERDAQEPPPLLGKDQEDRLKKSEYVQGMLLSTILDDDYYDYK